MTLRGVPILGHELSREVFHPRAWGQGFESPLRARRANVLPRRALSELRRPRATGCVTPGRMCAKVHPTWPVRRPRLGGSRSRSRTTSS
jgi:hypothetical protein